MSGVVESKIRGIEQEYPLSAAVPFNPSLLVSAAIQGLKRVNFSRIVNWDISAEVTQEEHERTIVSSFARNGCRIYDDLGHLEISTPSYNAPLDALAYERASEIYAFVGAREASFSLKKKVSVHKNNVANFFAERRGIVTNTYATHGNTLTLRAACKDWRRVERALIPWFVARIVFCGGGDVVAANITRQSLDEEISGVKFVISPRAMFVTQRSSLSTTASRGILNTRDQPHAARKYWRLHDIHYEALRCEYAIIMRDVTQTMVMRAFELGLLDDAPQLEDPVAAIKKISVDTQSCEWKLRLENGETTDAVEILDFYLERVERMYEEGEEKGFWDEFGLKHMKKLFERLNERRLEAYVDGIDWVTKLAFLVNYEPKKAEEGISICNHYALLDEKVLFYVQKGAIPDALMSGAADDSIFDPEDSLAFASKEMREINFEEMRRRVTAALSNPPENTRDFFRANVMKAFPSQVLSVSWATLSLSVGSVTLDEPFMLNREELEELGVSFSELDAENDSKETLRALLQRVKSAYAEKVRGL
ncbi:MAG: hypothetical protein DRN91_00690 [Candidatus Alkanophagales archaeon]|nr:MAG: hypothetical protein DRN91_00690 [Candidatus Alkanophagales archaeon]